MGARLKIDAAKAQLMLKEQTEHVKKKLHIVH